MLGLTRPGEVIRTFFWWMPRDHVHRPLTLRNWLPLPVHTGHAGSAQPGIDFRHVAAIRVSALAR